MRQLLTLCLPFSDDQILLGMKKRGFGEGRFNGFGGKVNEGESLDAAAKRELEEECGLVANSLRPAGILEFTFVDEEKTLEVHIFAVEDYDGEPKETEEMSPQWFSINNIPFTRMWADDQYWFPPLLAGQKFKGYFHFDRPADPKHPGEILNYELRIVDQL